MRIISSLDEMTETARGWLAGGSVGFVPTMGYLHVGHRALVQAAKQECEISVVSIFVNPLQFSSKADFARYPHDLVGDLQLLNSMGVDVVFTPRTEDIYPPHFATFVALTGPLAVQLEGASRPGYIQGIATVMTKLLQLVRPDITYLGQKDAQQAAVIRQIVNDLNIDIRLRVLPTVREPDGLAVSSQNISLSASERQAAKLVYGALLAAKALIANGERRPAILEKTMTNFIAVEPLIGLEYAVVCHPDTFETIATLSPPALLVLAATIGNTRLTDNILWTGSGQW